MTNSIKAMPNLAIPPVASAYSGDSLKALQSQAQKSAALEKGIGNNALPGKTAAAREAEQTKAAEQFEALLLQEMFKSMWATVPKGQLLSGSQEEGFYRDMLNEALAESVSRGQGLGIKDVITKEFTNDESKRKEEK